VSRSGEKTATAGAVPPTLAAGRGGAKHPRLRPVGHRHLGAGEIVVEADQLAVGPRSPGDPGEAERKRLEEVRLAGSVRAVDQGDALAGLDDGFTEVAKPARLEQPDEHSERRYTFSRIGMTR
jgi:hypothetical protein